uniref:Receptor-binding cancer antigen expressed on SiSo cells n=1 Tax=Magallana gigas TaxID=29159 RepID=K1R0F7_MAGGI
MPVSCACFPNFTKMKSEEFQAWDDWDSESKRIASNGLAGNSRTKKDSQGEEDDIDFFSDMTPRIKKQKKGSELGSWEDTENAWGEESLEDLSWQADEAIKQSRKSEQQRRLQEHARRKMEKEQGRSKKDSSFAAVRLSS